MSGSISLERYPALRRIANWWRCWTQQNATLSGLQCMGPDEVERLAHDVGLTSADLRTLAGKWPDSAGLLSRRLALLGLNESRLDRTEPQVVRDLQRCCSLCTDKQRCAHDLTDDPFDETWRDYCPNAQTLEALTAEARNAAGQTDETQSEGKQ